MTDPTEKQEQKGTTAYLDLAIVGKMSQGCHHFGHGGCQCLLHRFLLPLGDSGEAWQQVDQIRSESQAGNEGGRTIKKVIMFLSTD